MIPVICKNFVESQGMIRADLSHCFVINYYLVLMGSLPPNAVVLVWLVAIISPYMDIIFYNLCTDFVIMFHIVIIN